ncbi:polysaccharide biosynthesis tyrosine autokinase [Catenovulum sp. 2E275]|uniref:GumC family protein n=1 Tax=Catenovulum sp. 2E275 TaxID=2980497 RepID=UPI0021CE45E0|nr:polysaccharide biosynthesis tyrosine autokinase [Catenovulum sp. 2E275]MCU4674814.1 polysaccharide biosynthesis tyrosine autokinase [Catenovulum sp. 2E275]
MTQNSKYTSSKEINFVEQSQGIALFDIAKFWMILKRNKWIIVLCGLIGLGIAGFLAHKAIPIYQASVKIQADPNTPSAISGNQAVSSTPLILFYETQYEIIQSRTVAQSVVEKLNLVERYKQAQQEKRLQAEDKSVLEGIISQAKLKVNQLINGEKQAGNGTAVEKASPSDEQIALQIAQKIQSGIKVRGGKKSQMIDISYQSDDPTVATEIVNAVADAYISFELQTRLSQIKDTAGWLSDQLTDLKQNLKVSEDKLQAYKQDQGLVNTQQQQQIVNTQLSNLNTELIKAQTQHAAAKELYSQAMEAQNRHNGYLSLSPVMQNAVVKDLVAQETMLSNKVIELSERYGEKHPKMIAARSDLKNATANLQQEVAKVINNIEKQFNLTQLQVNNIKALIEQNKQEIQSLQGNNFELARLEREVEENRRVYDSFVKRLMEADLSGEYEASNIKIIDKATLPKKPIKPNKKMMLATGVIFGLIFAAVLIFVKESLERSFQTPENLENKLKISALGITEKIKSVKKQGKPEVQYLTNNRSTFAESINTIRTGILFNQIDNPPKTILITSSTGSEGKSTLAANLAFAFSQLDKTLLLELDLRKPSLVNTLKLDNPLGLSEILTERVDFLQATNQMPGLNNLDIIHSGEIPKNPLELISSKRFSYFLESLKQEYTHIIIDSPPVLPVSDACVLAQMSDAVILAVQANNTKISTAQESIKRLHKANANITGGVLTAVHPEKMYYYGEYQYQAEYYGYQAT